jgi:hypothetical protein
LDDDLGGALNRVQLYLQFELDLGVYDYEIVGHKMVKCVASPKHPDGLKKQPIAKVVQTDDRRRTAGELKKYLHAPMRLSVPVASFGTGSTHQLDYNLSGIVFRTGGVGCGHFASYTFVHRYLPVDLPNAGCGAMVYLCDALAGNGRLLGVAGEHDYSSNALELVDAEHSPECIIYGIDPLAYDLLRKHGRTKLE